MKLCIFGSGYVGLVTGTCYAETGNHVICVDTDKEKIDNLNKGILPIYEPGLDTLVAKNVKSKRLSFTTEASNSVKNSEVIFIAVGTPPDQDGSADLQYVLAVAKTIALNLSEYKTIVLKSTVPVGTEKKVRKVITENSKCTDFDVISNPEFLKEGSAINDFMFPDRIVIGHSTEKGKRVMTELNRPYIRTNNPILFMDNPSAELTKYAANSFLAVKISFMNEISRLCEKVGANVDDIRLGMGHDTRIGHQFLFPGVGYGGSCFPKDVKALCSTAAQNNLESRIITAAEEVNASQKELLFDKIKDYYKGDLTGKKIGIWGLSFKPKTDDMREAPSITIIEKLLEAGAKVSAFDPVAQKEAKWRLPKEVEFASNAYDAIKDSDALAIITEWNEFRTPDFNIIKKEVKDRVLFDGRNLFNLEDIKRHNINYISIGRKDVIVD
jgi:UDPglucose 6-dehydrogenase